MNRRKFTQTCLAFAPTVAGLDRFGGCANKRLKKIPKTDTHTHLFDLENFSYSWLDNVPEINRTFTIEDFRKASKRSNVGKILFMESGADAGYEVQEAHWVKGLANDEPRIKGIIAKLALGNGKKTVETLHKLEATQLLKGVRGRFPDDAGSSQKFLNDMKLLANRNLTFDLLLTPQRMAVATALAKKCPHNIFILDHLGNPDIKKGALEQWKKGILALSELPNVFCKMSGIITRVGKGWTIDHIKPYVFYAMEQFGMDRLVYGGDWPVVLRAGSYVSWTKAFEKLTKGLSDDELRKVYHLNADRAYNI